MTETAVVVTGLGLMCGLGLDVETAWTGLLKGDNPVKRFSLFEPAGLRASFGIELPNGADRVFAEVISPRRRKQMTRATMIAVATADSAAADAGLDLDALDPTRVGVVIGATGTGYAPMTADTDPHRILKNMACAAASWVSLTLHTKGPAFVVSTACSSGAYALHAAYMLIAGGECDVVIAGAADSALNYLDVEGFQSLMALSEDEANMRRASMPFDVDRSGFVMGEGGGMLVLENETFARERGALSKARLHRPALSSEAYNIISPSPSGECMIRCMEKALGNAGLAPHDIDYINAHGTSTPLNDFVEAQAIKAVFKESATRVSVSSTKSATGHCLSGAAGVEAVLTVKTIQTGVIPPTLNLEKIDPQMDLDFTPNIPRQRNVTHAMSNAFAFGGHNSAVVFSKI